MSWELLNKITILLENKSNPLVIVVLEDDEVIITLLSISVLAYCS